MAASHIDTAVAAVLSASRIKLTHPGDSKLSELYPTPQDCTSVLAEAVPYRGQLRISPTNQPVAGGNTSFTVSSSSVLKNFTLHFHVALPAAIGLNDNISTFAHLGWGFDMIDSIEVTYSNSLMQSMYIRGQIMRELALLTCRDQVERHQLLLDAGNVDITGSPPATASAADYSDTRSSVGWVSIPLTFLNNMSNACDGSWGIDGSVLAGPIQILINWAPNFYRIQTLVATGTGGTDTNGAAVDWVATVSKCSLTAETITLQDANFSVKKAMMVSPELIYSIPSRFVTSQSLPFTTSGVAGGKFATQTFNLNSCPSGMLEAIVLYAQPNKWMNPTAVDNILRTSVTMRAYSLRLSFGGQNIVKYDSYAELKQSQRFQFGEDLSYYSPHALRGASGGSAANGAASVRGDILVIPFTVNSRAVFKNSLNENLPSYGGAQLQLEVGFLSKWELKGLDSDGSRIFPLSTEANFVDTNALVDGIACTLHVGFIVSSILEVNQGTVDLQL